MRNLLLSLLLLLPWGACHAFVGDDALVDKGRRIESVWHLSLGKEYAKDSYLSLARFSGTEVTLQGEWSKRLPQSQSLGMCFDAEIGGATLLNSRHTKRMIDFGLEAGWSLFSRLRPLENLRVDVGGRLGIGGGLLYIAGNGNNPVSARADADLSIVASAGWQIKIGKQRFLLSDTFRFPIAGLFFTPQYGESYYEIYFGNHSGLVHFGGPWNRVHLHNVVSVGLPVGRTVLEIGYGLDYLSVSANHLKTRILRDSFVLGVRF